MPFNAYVLTPAHSWFVRFLWVAFRIVPALAFFVSGHILNRFMHCVTLRWGIHSSRKPRGSIPVRNMPPRRSSHFTHVPLQYSSVMECLESRLKRLRPVADVGQSEITTPAASGPDGTQAASSSDIYRPVPSIPTRSDAPVIRKVRRGSATDALSSRPSMS